MVTRRARVRRFAKTSFKVLALVVFVLFILFFVLTEGTETFIVHPGAVTTEARQVSSTKLEIKLSPGLVSKVLQKQLGEIDSSARDSLKIGPSVRVGVPSITVVKDVLRLRSDVYWDISTLIGDRTLTWKVDLEIGKLTYDKKRRAIRIGTIKVLDIQVPVWGSSEYLRDKCNEHLTELTKKKRFNGRVYRLAKEDAKGLELTRLKTMKVRDRQLVFVIGVDASRTEARAK